MSDQTQANYPKEALLSTDVEGSDSSAELALSSATASRRLCLLSNGTYSVMLSDSGSGFSRWRDLSITRWREDATRDSWGSYLLLRDEDSGAAWSATRQPLGVASKDVAVNFSAGLAEFVRRDDALDSTLEIAVAVEADVELRRLTVHNRGKKPRTLSVTSYTELVVGSAGADNAHPAFSKMFVQTEWDARHGVLLATRRRRADGDPDIWAAHALQIEGQPADRALEHETDRARFLGRCRTLRDAQAMQPGAALSNTTGCVLDPIFSLRKRVTLAPGASVRLLLWTRLADSREGALAMTTELDNANAARQLFAGAASFAAAEHARLGINAAQAARFENWLSALLISDPRQRAAPDLLVRGRGGPPTLWAAGISGDRPIVLLRLDNPLELSRVRDLLLAQNDWRSKRLAVDVVLLNTAIGATGDALHSALEPLVSAQQTLLKVDAPVIKAELFTLRDHAISDDLRNGLLTLASVLLDASEPTRTGQFVAPTASMAIRACTPAQAASAPLGPLEFSNGSGGFSHAGRAYHIHLDDRRCTPAPWVNVIANPEFGFLVSAEGGGYVWSGNSQQNPITPWPNDPVSDTPHEALYLRDEDSGAVWSATALPMRVVGANYHITHGKGYSCFTNDAHGIELELLQCVPTTGSIKLSRLRLCNRSTRTRHLLVTGYVEWALGANGTTPAPFVITSRDELTGALFARNPWRSVFGGHVAFVDLAGLQQSMSGDRGEFLGPLGAVDQPAALQGDRPLSGRLGAGLDPCGALQTRIEL
ncbi:MAG: glycosyl transferase family 36, partial [Pseudomonadota bacterium]|nr:glycosyl transferase family 36 [Pseudomonadota bacterium]